VNKRTDVYGAALRTAACRFCLDIVEAVLVEALYGALP
jgi:2,4-dienoyl-CoA reductase-like NADH-dependent reductase (Old Yellow Enzyme family)